MLPPGGLTFPTANLLGGEPPPKEFCVNCTHLCRCCCCPPLPLSLPGLALASLAVSKRSSLSSPSTGSRAGPPQSSGGASLWSCSSAVPDSRGGASLRLAPPALLPGLHSLTWDAAGQDTPLPPQKSLKHNCCFAFRNQRGGGHTTCPLYVLPPFSVLLHFFPLLGHLPPPTPPPSRTGTILRGFFFQFVALSVCTH